MGVFSWTCAHCKHSILVHSDEGINDWMQQAVVLSSTGDVYQGTYDGYGRLECEDGEDVHEAMEHGAVMVHEACWEVAGKPAFWHYRENGLASTSAEDQGYFFDDEHDVIDPRVTDPVERECLLGAGRELREQRRFDERAREVGYMIQDSRFGGDSWHLMFTVIGPVGEPPVYALVDKFHRETKTDASTEEHAEQFALRAWTAWLDSEEFTKLKARSAELVAAARERWIEQLKEKGRFEVGYKPSQGDTVLREGERDWTGGRQVFVVRDKVTGHDVAVMDGPDKEFGRKTFVETGPRGTQSPEFKARMEGMWASRRESERLAIEEAARLNTEWAAAGYPVEEQS